MRTEKQSGANRQRKPLPHAFKPGQSGNPKGRPRLTEMQKLQRAEAKRLARQTMLKQLDIQMIMCENADVAQRALKRIITAGKDDKDVLAAIRLMAEFGWHKPIETKQVAISDVTPQPDGMQQLAVAGEELRAALAGSSVIEHGDG